MGRHGKHAESVGKREPGRRLERSVLALTAFVCGAVIMVVELLAARLLAPLFGTCIVVWTSVIAVTLLALALGYTLGGRLADRWPRHGTLSGLILLAGALLALADLCRQDVLMHAAALGLRAGSLLAATVLFGPPLLLLGTVAPFVVRLYTRGLEQLGREVGLLYAISTAGSFAGTLISGFWLIPWLGLSRLLACTAVLLVLLSGSYFVAFRRGFGAGAALGMLGLVGLAWWQGEMTARAVRGDGWELLANRDGLYGQLKVCELDGGERRMLIDGINQGAVHWPAATPASRYVYAVAALTKAAVPEARSALVVGLGTGLVPNLLSELGVAPEVVEIDPLVARLQRDYFQKGERPFPVHLADARRFVSRCDRSFDVIVMDAFSGDAVPAHLLTKESFAEFAEHVTRDGAVILNLVTVVGGGHSEALAAVLQTMREVFPQVRPFSWRTLEGDPVAANVLILAQTSDRRVDVAGEGRLATGPMSWYVQMALGNELAPPMERAVVLSDDHNPIDLLLTESAEIWRRDILADGSLEMLLR